MLAYDLGSSAFIEYIEKVYGRQRALKYLNKMVQIMNKAGEDWDNCKTVDENLSKLIGDLTQMLLSEVKASFQMQYLIQFKLFLIVKAYPLVTYLKTYTILHKK